MKSALCKRTAPKIFWVWRCPSVGICGWLPRLAQVACRVGVCRNEASSSKTITAPSLLAFFLDSVGIADPFALLLEIGLHQPRGGPLHRVTQLLQQLAHMPRGVGLPEFRQDDLAFQPSGPK